MWYDSRQMKRCKSDEIADALRGELESGCYRAGKALPSVAELRERFGTGTFAIRAAVRQLRDEGFVELRPRIGIVATEKGGIAMKGRILFVCVGTRGSYFAQRLSVAMALRFDAARWSYMPVFLESAHDGHIDVSPLVHQIAEGVRFAIVLACERQVMDVLGRAGVPYVVLNGYARDYPDAVGVVREDFKNSYDEFINVMRERHVKSVVEFDVERIMDRAFKAQFASAGIAVRRILIERDNECPWTLADVKRLGHAAVSRFFAVDRNRRNPPDAVLFDDDYLAEGGLVALYEAGLRIPNDIRVVFYSNRGNEPVLGVSAARIENDPIACADVVAKYVLKLMAGRKCQSPRNVWRFIPGDSL